MPMYRIPCVKYRQINHLCIFASGPNLVFNIFLINEGMFSVGGGGIQRRWKHKLLATGNLDTISVAERSLPLLNVVEMLYQPHKGQRLKNGKATPSVDNGFTGFEINVAH